MSMQSMSEQPGQAVQQGQQVQVSEPVKLAEPVKVEPKLTEPTVKRSRSWVGALVLVLLLVIVLVGAYAVTLAPGHYAQSQAERVSGGEEISVGNPAVVTVVPAVEWSTRPLVTPLFGELQLLKNPAVIFGVSPGVQLGSPDGMLQITLEPLGTANAEAVFAAEGQPDAAVQEEVLSTGLALSHVNTGESSKGAPNGMVAIVGPDSNDSVLVRVMLSEDANLELTDYLPALSELFETIALTS